MALPSNIMAGDFARAEDVRALAAIGAYKAADETVTSMTLHDDDSLALALPANTVWNFTLNLLYSGSAAGSGDLKFGWTFPTGLTMRYTHIGLRASSDLAPVIAYTTEGNTVSFGTSGSGKNGAVCRGTIFVTGAGTLRLQWAPNSAAVTTSVLAGSDLTAYQIG